MSSKPYAHILVAITRHIAVRRLPPEPRLSLMPPPAAQPTIRYRHVIICRRTTPFSDFRTRCSFVFDVRAADTLPTPSHAATSPRDTRRHVHVLPVRRQHLRRPRYRAVRSAAEVVVAQFLPSRSR